MILSLIWFFSRDRFQNDENLFNTPIFELYIFTNIWIPEEEIFETVPRTVVKLLYRQLRGKLRFRRQSKENGRIER